MANSETRQSRSQAAHDPEIAALFEDEKTTLMSMGGEPYYEAELAADPLDDGPPTDVGSSFPYTHDDPPSLVLGKRPQLRQADVAYCSTPLPIQRTSPPAEARSETHEEPASFPGLYMWLAALGLLVLVTSAVSAAAAIAVLL